MNNYRNQNDQIPKSTAPLLDKSNMMMLYQKRRFTRILIKTLMIIISLATMSATIYGIIFMKQFIDYRNTHGLPSSNPLHSIQNIDEAEFDSFGIHLEPLWRAFLFANVGLVFLFTLYIPFATFWNQYYVIMTYMAFMACQLILSIGSEYFAVPFYFISIIYFISILIGHSFCHLLRLDILDEMNAIKDFNQ